MDDVITRRCIEVPEIGRSELSRLQFLTTCGDRRANAPGLVHAWKGLNVSGINGVAYHAAASWHGGLIPLLTAVS